MLAIWEVGDKSEGNFAQIWLYPRDSPSSGTKQRDEICARHVVPDEDFAIAILYQTKSSNLRDRCPEATLGAARTAELAPTGAHTRVHDSRD